MKGEFEARITLERLPLSRASSEALRHLERYDVIVFTSKNAERLFRKVTRRRVAPPQVRSVRVGPRNELLKLDLKGKRVLFPRSAAAPSDIIHKLRARGTIVRVVPLYRPKPVPVSHAQKGRFADGTVKRFYFKSPSAVHGLLAQCRGRYRKAVLSIPARCIGKTTAKAARQAGFVKVFTT